MPHPTCFTLPLETMSILLSVYDCRRTKGEPALKHPPYVNHPQVPIQTIRISITATLQVKHISPLKQGYDSVCSDPGSKTSCPRSPHSMNPQARLSRQATSNPPTHNRQKLQHESLQFPFRILLCSRWWPPLSVSKTTRNDWLSCSQGQTPPHPRL